MSQKDLLRDIVTRDVSVGHTFYRQDVLVWAAPIIEASQGKTPEQTISRLLQELRKEGTIEFVDDDGTYKRLT